MDSYRYFEHLIKTFNWHNPSWDLFILLAWLGVAVIYAFAAGRSRIMSILISVYMSKLVVIEAPFLSGQIAKRLSSNLTSWQQLITFGLLFILFFIFLSRYAFRTSADSRRLYFIGFGLIFAFLQVGLLINIVLTFIVPAVNYRFSPLIKFLFIDQPAGFVWLILPIIFLVILGRYISAPDEP